MLAQVGGLVGLWYGMPLVVVACMIAAVLLYSTRYIAIVATITIALSVGISVYSLHHLYRQVDAWHELIGSSVKVCAQVNELIPFSTKAGYRYKLLLTIKSVNASSACAGTMATVWLRSFPSCRVDDRISCYLPITKVNREWLRDGTIITAFMHRLPLEVIHRPLFSWRQHCSLARYQLLKALQQHLSPSIAYLNGVLFVGAASAPARCSQQVKELFARWGISHYLARSGLHVALICMLWYWMLTMIGCPLRWRYGAMLGVLAIFALLTYPSISFWRAGVFLAVRHAAAVAGWHMTSLTALALTVTILLMLFPAALFAVDFQLTVGLALIVLLASRAVSQLSD